jgi:hypothetical protein
MDWSGRVGRAARRGGEEGIVSYEGHQGTKAPRAKNEGRSGLVRGVCSAISYLSTDVHASSEVDSLV